MSEDTKVQLTFAADRSLALAADELAKREGLSRSAVLRRALIRDVARAEAVPA